MSYRETAGRCAGHIRLKGYTESTLASKHDKRGARFARASPNFYMRSYYVRLRLRARPQGTRGEEDSVTARKRTLFFGMYLRKSNRRREPATSR